MSRADGSVSYPERLDALSAQRGDQVAIVLAAPEGTESVTSWRELAEASLAGACALAAAGVGGSSLVAVALPNGPAWYAACFAAWRLGASVLPADPRLTTSARTAVLEVARTRWPRTYVVDRPLTSPVGPSLAQGVGTYPVSEPGFAMLSGGSTGRPKIIVNDGAHAAVPATGRVQGLAGLIGMRADQVQLVAGPLFHGAPASWSSLGLFHGHTLVLMARFDAARAVGLIQDYSVQWAMLVPTMMRRIAQVPGVGPAELASIQGIAHASAACPPSVKRAWFDLVGPGRVVEAFGGSEAAGVTLIDGVEWLQRPGSVGRPADGWEAIVLDDDGAPVPAGEVGLIHFRATTDRTRVRFTYVGAQPNVRPDGWVNIGDLGRMDDDGYLYVADRRTDLVITGGANVYPAEVEAVLLDHPGVSDAAVIGLPDADLGRRVHAVVEPREPDDPPTVESLLDHCRRSLSLYKVPRSVEFVDRLPRNEQGKLRRGALVEERDAVAP